MHAPAEQLSGEKTREVPTAANVSCSGHCKEEEHGNISEGPSGQPTTSWRAYCNLLLLRDSNRCYGHHRRLARDHSKALALLTCCCKLLICCKRMPSARMQHMEALSIAGKTLRILSDCQTATSATGDRTPLGPRHSTVPRLQMQAASGMMPRSRHIVLVRGKVQSLASHNARAAW
jgi:hypothetical protein